MKCPRLVPIRQPERLAAVESEHARWLAAHADVPGVEVHVEPDATWMIQPGSVWANAVVRLRLAEATADGRLDRLVRQYRATGRGAGFWLSPFATPTDLPARLTARGFRCRKHFPGMYRDLQAVVESNVTVADVTFEVVQDYGIFASCPHPYFGPIRTAQRRFELARLTHLHAGQPDRIWDLVAMRNGVPVGSCTLFFDDEIVGFHDVGVLRVAREQGIGTALMRHACGMARARGVAGAVLIASSDGFGVYTRAGFREVGRVSYWYRQFHAA